MTPKPTVRDIVRGLKPFIQSGSVHELRILDCVDGSFYLPFTMSGYFDSHNLNDLARAALKWTDKAAGCYVTMNPVNPDLLARAANRIIRATKSTKSTSDADIVARRRLTLDFDPERPAGISSRDEEKVLASQVAWKVQADLHALGWPEPLCADSGNGFHLNFLVDLPVDDGGLTERFLKALSARYTTPEVKVDASLFNPGRIIKLYETWSRKGDSILTRPHRLAMVTSAPEVLEVVNRALLEEFIRENAPPEPEVKPAKSKPAKSRPAARILTKGGKPVWDLSAPPSNIPDVDLRPGDDFNARADWAEILGPHQWTIDKTLSNGEVRWTRPGKDGKTSATTGHSAADTFHVFTDSRDAAPFEALKNYSKFEAYTLLEHGGRRGDAVKDLVQQGYGSYVDNDGEVKPNPPPPGWKREPAGAAVGQTSADSVTSGGAHGVESVESVVALESEDLPPLRLGKLPEPGVFPIDVLPDSCKTVAQAIARAVGCDVASVAGSIVAIAAGVIGRSVHLKLQDNWIVPPIIFHANVADPGQGKSWGQRYLTDGYLSAIEEELEAEFAALKRNYRALCKADKNTHHDKPIPRQLLIDDSTIEALFMSLSHHPRGLLSVLDELSVLFAGLNQYKGGQGADRSHILKLWTGARVSINRIRNEFGEPLRIPFPHLSFSGNIPPDNLCLIRGPNGNDGMPERWVYTFPGWHKKLKASERGCVSQRVIDGWDRIVERLWKRKLDHDSKGKECPRLLVFDNAGRGEFFSRYDRHVEQFNDPSFPHSLRGAWSKLETYAGRFALVLHCLHWADSSDPDVRSIPDHIADCAWQVTDYFKGEHKRVIAALESQGLAMPEGARLHLNWIKNHPDATSFSERDISVTYAPNKGYTPAMMVDGREWLSDRNAILRISSTVPEKSKPGIKPSPVWRIHSDLRATTETTHSTDSMATADREVSEI